MRLDEYLAKCGTYPSRSGAKDGILRGEVFVDGKVCTKPATDIQSQIVSVQNKCPYVSRAGLKLRCALNKFGVDVKDKICLDIGTSTGGFADCLLKSGAKFVFGVEVGTDVLSQQLVGISNLKVWQNTNFLDVNPKDIGKLDIVTCDVSFTSILPILNRLKSFDFEEAICLIKPQFEAGKEIISRCKGVIKNSATHIKVLQNIMQNITDLGFAITNITYSCVLGGSGNIEFLVQIKKHAKKIIFSAEDIVLDAYKNLIKPHKNI